MVFDPWRGWLPGVVAGETPKWPHERRQLPAHLVAETAANPGGSVAEIDGSMVRNPDGYVPPRVRDSLGIQRHPARRVSGNER
jgi:hypothetical protein